MNFIYIINQFFMRSLFFVFYFLFSFSLFSQNEGNIWYFGSNAGIDFNTGNPVALGNGQLITNEGCASICDANGSLLFYTDGSTVYNANHIAMPNGTGLNGDPSSTQSAIIIKKPGTVNIYTIFTVTAQAQSAGLQYSDVDMTLDGGTGDIVNTVSNVSVYTPTCEKITAIKHENGIDYWLVSKDYSSPDLRSYLYNSFGLATTYITSDGDFTPGDINETIGYLKTNASGNKIAMANYTANNVILYDFNNSTGAITNPITLQILSAYGIEFSPNGQFLYVCQAGASNQVLQYDLLAGDESDIQASEISLGILSSTGGALQLAPDQKIYVTYYATTSLGTISNPNLAGISCNFNDEGFDLDPGTSGTFGLPTFYNDILLPSTILSMCIGDSVDLTHAVFTNHNWVSENDPTNILSTDPSYTVSPNTTTTYMVFEGTDTFRYEVIVNLELPLNLGPDICDAVDSVVLNVAQPGLAYLWQDGSDESSFTATSTGIYWVQITDSVCTSVDSIFIQFETIIIGGNHTVYCDSTVTLAVIDSNPEPGIWTYVAPPGGPQNVIFDPNINSLNPNITAPELGEYIFTYTSACGVIDTHSVSFESFPPLLNIQLNQACNFEINLVATNAIQNGEWTATGPEGETINIADLTQPNTTAQVSNYGEYTFTYTYDFCFAGGSSIIEIQSIEPEITNTIDRYICDKTIPLSAIVPGQAEQWSVTGPGIVTFDDFQNTNTFATVADYGDYTFFFHGCGGIDSFDVSFIKNAPTIHAPTYVYCGTEALAEVLYYEDNIGVWSYQAGTDENITLTELDDHTLNINSDAYGQVDLTYTTCDTSTTVNIVFMCELEIPNVFTPNNDGLNNEFFISRLTPTYYDYSRFVVYDRWGVEVYTNGRYGIDGSWWNGKTANKGEDLPAGVYYYVLNLHNKVNDLDENYKGSLHIFR